MRNCPSRGVISDTEYGYMLDDANRLYGVEDWREVVSFLNTYGYSGFEYVFLNSIVPLSILLGDILEKDKSGHYAGIFGYIKEILQDDTVDSDVKGQMWSVAMVSVFHDQIVDTLLNVYDITQIEDVKTLITYPLDYYTDSASPIVMLPFVTQMGGIGRFKFDEITLHKVIGRFNKNISRIDILALYMLLIHTQFNTIMRMDLTDVVCCICYITEMSILDLTNILKILNKYPGTDVEGILNTITLRDMRADNNHISHVLHSIRVGAQSTAMQALHTQVLGFVQHGFQTADALVEAFNRDDGWLAANEGDPSIKMTVDDTCVLDDNTVTFGYRSDGINMDKLMAIYVGMGFVMGGKTVMALRMLDAIYLPLGFSTDDVDRYLGIAHDTVTQLDPTFQSFISIDKELKRVRALI